MKNFISLKIMDRFSWIFRTMGVDYPLMRKILQIKLTMDRRRTSTLVNSGKKNNKSDNEKDSSFRTTLMIYGFYGCMFLLFFFVPLSLFGRMTVIYTIFILMITTVMISDFSTVLLDLKDKNILLVRPVDSRTVNIAKIVHIFLYLFMISSAFLLPIFIVGIFVEGVIFGLLLLIQLFFILAIVVFLTSFLYGFILKYFDGEKLKDIINYVQIGISVILPISYQFVFQIFDLMENNIAFEPVWWTYILPSAWFAAPFQLFIGGAVSSSYITLSIFSLVLPIVGLYLYNHHITNFFENNLIKLNNSSREEPRLLHIKDKLIYKITAYTGGGHHENNFLRFIRMVLSEDRRLKLSIYPLIASSFIFPIIFLRDHLEFDNLLASIDSLSTTNAYLWLYSAVIMLPNIVSSIGCSDNYKGAWLFKTLPVSPFPVLYRAKVKAVVLKYELKVFLVIGILFALFFGVHVLDDLFLMLINMILLTIVMVMINKEELPFSVEFSVQKKSSGSTAMFVASLGIGGILAGLHVLLNNMGISIWFDIFPTIIIIILLWNLALGKIKTAAA